ncbi:beta-hexosaminidase subunit alpha [Agrilus planipennis]|uniref:beta-N-acetylhexosaminidase n=1 Tax=Agrilus planipennis TaxID=224129 RepID=A0A1W4XBS7_AGRPL|nr:beta-hexosaminidase subunit alpha [Agrilus planipennis]
MGIINGLDILLKNKCETLPSIDMDENYELSVSGSKSNTLALLTSDSVWGILRGLESFSQLLYASVKGNMIFINETYIEDYPRYTHRGLLIDTSRHYLPLKTIKLILEGMEYNKLNVLHWHITDDESFPYQSRKFPELSDKGAYHPEMFIYTQNDILKIIRYATQRGIRVIPEFDTPGHTRSWGEGRPELLTVCDSSRDGTNFYGPINPSNSFVFSFMEEFFKEIKELFPERYMHLGGDEVSFECWKANKDVNSFMRKMNITGDYAALEGYYIQRLLNIVNKLNISPVVWEEVFNNGVKLPTSTVVQVWIEPWKKTVQAATNRSHGVLLSSCWYLDHLATGGDWINFYKCEPSSFAGTPVQKKLVIGGEACMWGEVVNRFNIIPRIFPRVSAVAEVLWSTIKSRDLKTMQSVSARLEEHTCRMNKRGISAQPPNGAGFCI